MTATSPLPGIVPATSALPPKLAGRWAFLARWARQSIALEPGDTAGRIAIAASALAASCTLGSLISDAGVFGFVPYQFARLAIYGASFLSGGIMAAGYLSDTRTARFAAILTTAMIAAYGLASLLQLPDWAQFGIHVAYGVGLLGTITVAILRAARRRLHLGHSTK